MIVTVTMNAALDRILTVPNFQCGHRHRASEKVTLAGGKGITVARALKRLGVPVVATGPRRWPQRSAHPRGARRGGDPQRLRPDRGRGAHVDRRRPIPPRVSSPRSSTGGRSSETAELEVLLEKIDYLARGAEMVVFAGSLPRGIDDDFYAEAIRDSQPPRRADRARLGRRAASAPASRQSRSSPPRTSKEAEAVVGQEFLEEGDFLDALDGLDDLGARNVLITYEHGCFASVRGRAWPAAPLPGRVADISRPSPRVGAGATLLAGFIAAWLEDTTARGRAAEGGRHRRRIDARGRRRTVRPARRRAHPAGRSRRRARVARRRRAPLGVKGAASLRQHLTDQVRTELELGTDRAPPRARGQVLARRA